jgi:hypothetical protein
MSIVSKTSLMLALLLLGCRRENSPAEPPVPATRNGVGLDAPGAAPSERGDLDSLDKRIPVPMLPMMARHQKQNMRDHLLAVEEIVAGAASGDFPAVERAAARLGYSEQMGRMCTHMGAGAHGFTERALEFHHTADTILAAAREHDQPKVLQALGATLARCTSCHAAFKQRVVDETTWKRLASRLEQ